MEWGREWGLLRAKCSTHCAAGSGRRAEMVSHRFSHASLWISMHA